jgi:hypothetical protein
MRLIRTAVAMLIVGSMAACSSSDKPETKSTKSSTPTPARYDPCELLSQPERDKAVGTGVEYQNESDANFREWSCAYGDEPAGIATVDVSYMAVRAPLWAAKLPNIVELTPSEDAKEVKAIYAAALKRAALAETDLAGLDAEAACMFWTAFQTERDAEIASGVVTESFREPLDEEFAPGEEIVLARAETCVDGVYASLSVSAPDADSKAGVARVTDALALVHQHAVARLPKG